MFEIIMGNFESVISFIRSLFVNFLALFNSAKKDAEDLGITTTAKSAE